MLENVRKTLHAFNESYKQKANKHRRAKVFQPGELVIARLKKERFPTGAYSKLSSITLGPIAIKHKISENAYVVDLLPNILTSATFNMADISPTI
ncbi:hypothetical protein MA16_Dca011886 [Dendrobium catenatum]|uniref:Tf2-1-like SH3-like domain-containing protein n=1 Tax=Dendrobium catenatum TaxID=906689 RepID=A0A2I0W2K8_9ASPA|nr:hypothetical protein MA16_Dca011886 [Dendrobium catenatum]